ncbi:hypothetical protein JMM59_04720 [Rhodovulum sulfidophilum]|uniref:hypothetical protein n=1 Tax=Rhodovulum sulfidophilum TaxID=35806 RepID=UPI001920E8AF|nr:hypothetical protein [Rhodovulum sulfidophilum]MBL3564315.1 hypothetical protein [Rhodovulum sulfidophilum]
MNSLHMRKILGPAAKADSESAASQFVVRLLTNTVLEKRLRGLVSGTDARSLSLPYTVTSVVPGYLIAAARLAADGGTEAPMW